VAWLKAKHPAPPRGAGTHDGVGNIGGGHFEDSKQANKYSLFKPQDYVREAPHRCHSTNWHQVMVWSSF
jgi:hypothetical protein